MFERFTAQARDVVRMALEEAEILKHPRVGTEHLLLALTRGPGPAAAVLAEAGVHASQVRADIERLVGSRGRLLGEEDAAALRTIGIDLDAVQASIDRTFGPAALTERDTGGRRWWRRRRGTGRSRFGPRAKKVLELSLREAIRLRHHEIGPEHVLLGLIREGEGLGARILVDRGVDLAELRRRVEAARGEAA